MRTTPAGQPILQSLPGLSEPFPVEPWRFAEKSDAEGLAERFRKKLKKGAIWHRKKVMQDIREHTATSFPPTQQDQWAAIDAFHDQYRTSDSVPVVPFSTPGATQSWHFEHGTPIDWRAAFAHLTLRFDR